MCCMLRWMLLGSRVGLGIVMCPLWRSAFGFACLFLFSHVFTGHRALGRLGRHCLARQFSRPRRYASCLGAYSLHRHLSGHTCHSSCFTRVAHMCHDMTGKRCDPESGSESFFFFWVTGELSTLRQLMKVPNESGLSPNNGLENVSLSDQSMASNPRKGQAKCPGAKTTSHDGRADHVMTHMCHPSKGRRMAGVTIQVSFFSFLSFFGLQGNCPPSVS